MTDRDPRLDSAYRAAPREEPPAELDERIRAAARRAVSAGPQPLEARAQAEARPSWVARWRVPMSIAATVVVAVTLSYMVQEEAARNVPIDGPPGGAAPAAVAPAEAEKAGVSAAAPAPAPAGQAAKVESARDDAVPPRAERRAPAERPRPVAPGANGTLAKEREGRQAASEAAPPASPTPQASGAPAEIQAAPAAAPPPAPAPAAKPAPAPAAVGRDRALAERPLRMEREAASVSAEQKARTPEEWLEALRRLKAQGRTDEFVRELAEFRRRYPDYKLPDDLAK